MGTLLLLLFWVLLSVVSASIASNKGNSGIVVFIGSLLLSPLIGLLIAALDRPNQPALDKRALKSGRLKRCPYCAELIKSKALLCHYCGKECRQQNQSE